MQQLFSKSSDWIWLDDTPEVNCYVEFINTFTIVSSDKIKLLMGNMPYISMDNMCRPHSIRTIRSIKPFSK